MNNVIQRPCILHLEILYFILCISDKIKKWVIIVSILSFTHYAHRRGPKRVLDPWGTIISPRWSSQCKAIGKKALQVQSCTLRSIVWVRILNIHSKFCNNWTYRPFGVVCESWKITKISEYNLNSFVVYQYISNVLVKISQWSYDIASVEWGYIHCRILLNGY